MDDKSSNVIDKVLRYKDGLHRIGIPLLHCSLWFFGLYWARFGAEILNLQSPQAEAILSVAPAIVVFFLEILVSFTDILIWYNSDNLLKMKFIGFTVLFFGVVLSVILFALFYWAKPTIEILFVMLMLSSSLLKFLEHRLINNLDKYVVPIQIPKEEVSLRNGNEYLRGYVK